MPAKVVSWIALCLLLLAAACRSPGGPALAVEQGPERALDWTVGRWEGVRRGDGTGPGESMVMEVRAILGGAGQIRELEVVHAGGVYRGFCVQVFDPERERWVRRYVNDVRRSFAEYEGEVDGDRSIWRSTSPTRTRESRLVPERPDPDRWLRTMSVSEDDGETWRVLWVDELRRR